MLETIQVLLKRVHDFNPKSEKEVENFRLKYLGKKGELNELFNTFKDVPSKRKKEFGAAINTLKDAVQQKVDFFKGSFKTIVSAEKADFTRPVNLKNSWKLLPIVSLLLSFCAFLRIFMHCSLK